LQNKGCLVGFYSGSSSNSDTTIIPSTAAIQVPALPHSRDKISDTISSTTLANVDKSSDTREFVYDEAKRRIKNSCKLREESNILQDLNILMKTCNPYETAYVW